MIQTTAIHEAEQYAINNIVRAVGRNAVVIEAKGRTDKFRFAAIPESRWERERELEYKYSLVQVYERGDYDKCPHAVEYAPPLQKNALRIEFHPNTTRCLEQKPEWWRDERPGSALMWLASGGETIVFGSCAGSQSKRCPLKAAA